MRDTSEAALERYYELLRAQSPLSRITATAALTSAVRRLAESAVRAADPDASEAVVRARVTIAPLRERSGFTIVPGRRPRCPLKSARTRSMSRSR
jgi:hypothetical protein